MATWIRQSTSVTVSMGPFLLNTDGVTLVTNLVGTGSNQTENTTTGLRISKNGGAFAARHATAGTSTYDAFGNYLVILDTTDTATLGALRMQFANGAAFCPVWMDFMIVPANVWDSMFGATFLKVDVTQLLTTAWLAPGVAGTPDVNTKLIGGQMASASGTVTFPNATLASTANITAGTITTVTNLTNAATSGDLTATMKTSVTTAATAATPIAASVTGAVGSVTGLTASNLDATISSRMATYSQPTGFLAATFPTGTVANTTNITAGTVTTATNLTNAPTAGDFTATMKTSLNAATPAVTVSDKTGFSLTSAYDPSKTASQAGDAMTLTAGERNATADAFMARTLGTEAYSADGVVPTLAQALFGLISITSEFAISGTTITCKKLDGTTASMTFTLDSSTVPTSRTRAT